MFRQNFIGKKILTGKKKLLNLGKNAIIGTDFCSKIYLVLEKNLKNQTEICLIIQ
jgi:hypothetical protein